MSQDAFESPGLNLGTPLSYILGHVLGFCAVIAIAIRPIVATTILRAALFLYALGLSPVN